MNTILLEIETAPNAEERKASPHWKTWEIRLRQAIERHIVGKLVDALLADGYSLSVSCDGGETREIEKSTDKAAILKEIMASDEDYVYCHKDGRRPHIFLVYGNSGWDVISDYSESLEPIIRPVYDYVESVFEY